MAHINCHVTCTVAKSNHRSVVFAGKRHIAGCPEQSPMLLQVSKIGMKCCQAKNKCSSALVMKAPINSSMTRGAVILPKQSRLTQLRRAVERVSNEHS